MNTRAIAITIAFAALAVVLSPAFSGIAIPAPYLPYLAYQVWEIPVVVAFFLNRSQVWGYGSVTKRCSPAGTFPTLPFHSPFAQPSSCIKHAARNLFSVQARYSWSSTREGSSWNQSNHIFHGIWNFISGDNYDACELRSASLRN
jgi:hypothetical protein